MIISHVSPVRGNSFEGLVTLVAKEVRCICKQKSCFSLTTYWVKPNITDKSFKVCNLLQFLPLGEFVALEMFGYTSSVIAHLLASLPFHSWKIFAFYLLYLRFIAVFFKKEKKRKNLECEANWVEVDKGFMYGFVFTFLLGSCHF